MPVNDPTEDATDMRQLVPESTTGDRPVSERQVQGFPATGQRRFASFSALVGSAETGKFVSTERKILRTEDKLERDSKAG